MKITAALIVRDAEPTIAACLESIRPHVDEIVVVDTGSTDRTPEIAKLYANRFERYDGCNRNPYTGQIDPVIWDFADARNRSFQLASHPAVVWVDADDVIEGAENLRSIAAELAAQNKPAVALLPYHYSFDQGGNCTCIHVRERVIYPAPDFHWLTPVHEVCLPRSPVAAATIQSGDVRFIHRAQWSSAQPGAKPREAERNKRILEAHLRRVGEGDVRAMYYMGVEYARHGQFGRARDVLRRYTELSGWSDERCLAQLELGRIAFQEGDCREALRHAADALFTKSWPDPYWLIAKCFWRMAHEGPQADHEYNLRRAYAWAERGRPLEDAQTVLFYNPMERHETEKIVAQIAAHFGDIDEAAASCRRGLKGMPGDPDLMALLRQYEPVRIGREIDTALDRLVHLGTLTQEARVVIEQIATGKLTVSVGNPEQSAPPVARIGAGTPVDETTLPPPADGCLDIVIVTGPAMEHWTPKTIEETGIGGSETMAWEMARGLARLGHRVRHYGWCTPEQEGVYEGVHWYDSARYRDVKCDALVVSRYPDLIDVGGRTRLTLLWLHDVHGGAALTPQRAFQFDRVLCLSQWHKRFVCEVYPFLDPGRVVVTRNGIDLSLFDPYPDGLQDEKTEELRGLTVNCARNPHRAVYSSSPDRGLQAALELWPLVRAEVPDAELHVFYGFNGLRRGRPADAALADKLEATAKATEGVVLHGRIPPRELAREFMRSGVWFYPTWFSETSCITAMQAQAAGLRCITTPIAALTETVGDRGRLVGDPPVPIDVGQSFECAPCSEQFTRQFVSATVLAMTDPDPAHENDLLGWLSREWVTGSARDRFYISALVSDWSDMLTSLVADIERDIVPPYYVAPVFEAEARRADEGEAA